MANFTPNVNLEKPLGDEYYLIPKFNANMDKIDAKFGELQNLGGIISGATAKTTPVDADTVALSDSAATGALKKLSWLNIKATLKAYFDTLYATIANLNLKAPLDNPTFTGVVTASQIKFPATQVPSADPNTLDDYEEGTFTPTIIGSTTAGVGTYVSRVAHYTKKGDSVTFGLYINVSAHTGTGNLQISGLPFLPLASLEVLHVQTTNLALSANNIPSAQMLVGVGAEIKQQVVGGGAISNVPLDTAFAIWVSGTYKTA